MKFFIALMLFSAVSFSKAGKEQIMGDVKAKSSIGFISYAKTLGIKSEVNGSFSDFSIQGTKKSDLEKSSVTVKIDANSINTRIKRRDRHLRSSDFFDVKTFPFITFKSKKITKLKNNNFRINGDLTIKNKTTNITIEVNATQQNKRKELWRVKGGATISRNKVGITFISPFYLPDIEDNIKIIFDVYMAPK